MPHTENDDKLRYRRTKSATRAEEITTKEEKQRKLQPDRPCHKPRDSLFSWSSGFDNFTGLVNWGFLLLSIGGFRLCLENLLKYGIRINPVQWYIVLSGKNEGEGHPSLMLVAYSLVPISICLLIEKGLAAVKASRSAEFLGKTGASATGGKAEKKKEEKKPQEKKSAPKREEEPKLDLGDEALALEPKSKDPFDAMPKGTFNFDDFKRFYSNEEEAKSIPYFWEKFDPENYSIWFGEYKYNEELAKVFMSCNLITGMFQRLDKMRKQAFASVCLFGEDNNSTISGVWVWRGQELAFPLSPDWQIDYDCYEWKKLDANSDETKKLVAQYFSWTGTDKNGRKFNQGKIFLRVCPKTESFCKKSFELSKESGDDMEVMGTSSLNVQ